MSAREAGRELDALIAEKVMGWTWYRWCPQMDADALPEVRGHRFLNLPSKVDAFAAAGWRNPPFVPASLSDPVYTGEYSELPRYSTDIAAAWLVVDLLRGRGIYIDIESLESGYVARSGWEGKDGDDIWMSALPVSAAEAPLAICLAALAAVEASQ